MKNGLHQHAGLHAVNEHFSRFATAVEFNAARASELVFQQLAGKGVMMAAAAFFTMGFISTVGFTSIDSIPAIFSNGAKNMNNRTLACAGSLSVLAALTHIAIIFGGPEWYRFFGAGEQMASLAEQGSMQPAIVTASIAAVLTVWGLYGFSGAGLIPRLPLQKFVLVAISFIYLFRALAGLFIASMNPGSIDDPYLGELQEQPVFMLVSSLVCLVFGLAYAIGTAQVWSPMPAKQI